MVTKQAEAATRVTIGLITRVRAAFGYTIPKQTLAFFFDGLAVLLKAGQTLPEALTIASRSIDPELKQMCATIVPRLRRGESLVDNLRPYAGRFPEIVMPIIEVGEVGGGMEGSARRLADSFTQSIGVEREFKYGAFDPWLVIIMMTIVQMVHLIILTLGAGQNATLVQDAVSVAIGTVLGFLFLAAVYLGGRLAARYLWRWRGLRLLVDQIKLAWPRLGLVTRNLSAARWARSFAVLWRAGVQISFALEVSSRSALNAYYEDALLKAARRTRAGTSLYQSLVETHLLPANLMAIVGTGETTGNLADILELHATEMEHEALQRAMQEMNTNVLLGQIILMLIVALSALGSLSAG